MIAVYGGTFDPIHRGHLSVARQASMLLGDAEIRLLLSARPSHRGSTGADVEHRWRMLELACQDHVRLVPDRSEVDRAGPSYAVLTLEALRRQHPDETFCWIVGQDSFATLPTWYRWQELFELTHFLVVPRPGFSDELPTELAQALAGRYVRSTAELLRTRSGAVWITKLATPAVSSSAIRQRARQGEPVATDVGPAVAAYVPIHSLYESPSVRAKA